MRRYVTVTETHHPVRVTVPADETPDPYRDAFARWPCDPCCFVAVEPIDCAELDTARGR